MVLQELSVGNPRVAFRPVYLPPLLKTRCGALPGALPERSAIAEAAGGEVTLHARSPSVIDVPLNIGFVGKSEQTGHPAQKPEKVFEPLVLMTTKPGDIVLDPMCGAGTTGAVCTKLGRYAILCDESEDYVSITERRLGIERV